MNRKQLLDPLLHLLEIPSVSTQEKYLIQMQAARHYLKDLFIQLGFKVKTLKGKKHDAIYAELITDKNLPTVLIYGHYDVQPPEPIEEWETPPFDPKVRNNKVFARGATDDKGQFMIHLMAVKTLIKQTGKLPVNFKFIIEGEEEIGSPSVENWASKYANTLFKSDFLVVSDGEMPERGQPSIDIGLRGLVYAEVQIKSAKGDVHSGQFGGVAENPANVLANIISKLKSEENKVLIPGFYDDVVPPNKEELKDYKALKTTKKQIKKEGGLYAIGGGESKFSLNERRWTRPTLDVNGIWGGYQDEGSKTIIPAEAGAKISMRLVPKQSPDKIYNMFKNYVLKLAPKTVKVNIFKHADCLPYKAPTNHPVFSLIKKSLKKSFNKEPVFISMGGSIGFVPVVANTLNVPCLLVDFGLPDENLHAPNEHFSLTNYYKGIEAMSDFYSGLEK